MHALHLTLKHDESTCMCTDYWSLDFTVQLLEHTKVHVHSRDSVHVIRMCCKSGSSLPCEVQVQP